MVPNPSPDFAAEVRAVLASPKAALVPVAVRHLVQRMAEQITTDARDLADLRQRVAAIESRQP